jgi:hypothetical protein
MVFQESGDSYTGRTRGYAAYRAFSLKPGGASQRVWKVKGEENRRENPIGFRQHRPIPSDGTSIGLCQPGSDPPERKVGDPIQWAPRVIIYPEEAGRVVEKELTGKWHTLPTELELIGQEAAQEGGETLEGMYAPGCGSLEQAMIRGGAGAGIRADPVGECQGGPGEESSIHSAQKRIPTPVPSDADEEEMTLDQIRWTRRFRKAGMASTAPGSGRTDHKG